MIAAKATCIAIIILIVFGVACWGLDAPVPATQQAPATTQSSQTAPAPMPVVHLVIEPDMWVNYDGIGHVVRGDDLWTKEGMKGISIEGKESFDGPFQKIDGKDYHPVYIWVARTADEYRLGEVDAYVLRREQRPKGTIEVRIESDIPWDLAADDKDKKDIVTDMKTGDVLSLPHIFDPGSRILQVTQRQ